MFDRKLYAMRRHRFTHATIAANFLHLEVEEGIIETLDALTKKFEKVWLYGQFYKLEPAKYGALQVYRRDIMSLQVNDNSKESVLCLDEEELEMPAVPAYDLIISHLSMHMINDLPGLLLKYRKMLRPKGLFIATLYGEHTLHELRHAMMQVDLELLGGAAPRVIPFVDVPTAGALLQRAGFAMPVASYERYSLRYNNIYDIFRDIRTNALANCLTARSMAPLTKYYLRRLEAVYASTFSSCDGLACTYDVLALSGSVD